MRMVLVRTFTLRALNLNVLIQAKHIPGLDNSLVNALSHQEIIWFRELDPAASECPGKLPAEVWQIGVMTWTEQ